jgi:nucleoid-associated protein YgaU
MGNFEKLSVLVIVVIIVMILVVALVTWTDGPPDGGADATMMTSGPALDPVSDLINPRPEPRVEPRPIVIPPNPEPPAPAPTPEPAPAPPPAPAPEVKPVAREHVVASGDTLEKISKKHYGTARHIVAIEKANPGVDPMRLRIGQKLAIPEVSGTSPSPSPGGTKVASGGSGAKPGEVYTVRRGDSLPEIARRAYGKIDRWHEIWLENFERIDDPDRLKAGTRLNLPK